MLFGLPVCDRVLRPGRLPHTPTIAPEEIR